MGATATLEEVREAWTARWPEALALWSPFTRLRPPRFCLTEEEEGAEGLTGSFAMIRLADQRVVISLRQVSPDLVGFPLEILGHEIGHHILCPADLADNARMLARIRLNLPTVEGHAPMVANLYADLLINDRLQRARGLDMAGVYATLADAPATGDADGEEGAGRFWAFYMRLYEVLWSLPRGRIARGELDERLLGDALLGARLVRSFAGRWLEGAGRFGALCLPYLLEETPGAEGAWTVWQDALGAGAGGFPDGLTGVEGSEGRRALHPSLDPELNGDLTGPAGEAPAEPEAGTQGGSRGQYREPFEYGEILRASGLDLSDHEVAVRYYRERAAGQLIPFPSRRSPVALDPLPEGTEPWDAGEELSEIDWVETALQGPVVIPGVTTVRRVWGTSPGAEPERVPVDLDLYVDSSGSMPNPQVTVSYLALAGAIVALSALRAGARVQATLWSGALEFTSTRGFVRDEGAVLKVLTGFFGGGTAFPIHVLRDTYGSRPPSAGPAHVLVVSDDGVNTMFELDEAGRPGREVARKALREAGGGGTMVLNLWAPVDKVPGLHEAAEDGWEIFPVRDWADLVAFARAFSRRRYEEPGMVGR